MRVSVRQSPGCDARPGVEGKRLPGFHACLARSHWSTFKLSTSILVRLLTVLLCALACAQVQAGTLFAIVTERAAPTAIEAAQRHLARHPHDRVVLRTPAQWMAAGDRQAGLWIAQADSVLAVSLFGDPARRLKEALSRHARARTAVLAFNGEASLSLMSRATHGSLHDFPAEMLRELAAESPAAPALRAAQAHPAARHWLAA